MWPLHIGNLGSATTPPNLLLSQVASRSCSPPFHVYVDHDIPKGKAPTLLVSVQDYHVYFFILTPLDTGLLAQLQVQLKRKHIPHSSSVYLAQGI